MADAGFGPLFSRQIEDCPRHQQQQQHAHSRINMSSLPGCRRRGPPVYLFIRCFPALVFFLCLGGRASALTFRLGAGAVGKHDSVGPRAGNGLLLQTGGTNIVVVPRGEEDQDWILVNRRGTSSLRRRGPLRKRSWAGVGKTLLRSMRKDGTNFVDRPTRIQSQSSNDDDWTLVGSSAAPAAANRIAQPDHDVHLPALANDTSILRPVVPSPSRGTVPGSDDEIVWQTLRPAAFPEADQWRDERREVDLESGMGGIVWAPAQKEEYAPELLRDPADSPPSSSRSSRSHDEDESKESPASEVLSSPTSTSVKGEKLLDNPAWPGNGSTGDDYPPNVWPAYAFSQTSMFFY